MDGLLPMKSDCRWLVVVFASGTMAKTACKYLEKILRARLQRATACNTAVRLKIPALGTTCVAPSDLILVQNSELALIICICTRSGRNVDFFG